jgi:hypothetical protein
MPVYLAHYSPLELRVDGMGVLRHDTIRMLDIRGGLLWVIGLLSIRLAGTAEG